MKDIFISHASNDQQIVKKICKELYAQDLSYWVSYENELFGASYASAIIEAIKNCKIFLALISKHSNVSTHVANEINSAVMRNKIVIPVRLDKAELSGVMEYYLASNHWIEYNEDDFEEFSCKLLKRIISILDPNGSPNCNEKPLKGYNRDSENEILQRAQGGEPEWQYKLGKAYYYGENGLTRDLQASVRWYRLAAEQGHPEAQCNLGWCYEVGDGTEQDLEKAFEWYKKAAENNCAMGQYSLGWMYENGVHVHKNKAKAFDWHEKAAKSGNTMACYKLGVAYSEGQLVDQDYEISNSWLMLAADDIVMAQYKLAEHIYFGYGCKKDIIKAKNMWLLSAERGYIKSYEALEKYYDIFYNAAKKSFEV